MAQRHVAHVGASLAVILAAGASAVPARAAASGTFTATGSTEEARFYNTATRLPSGQVLLAGGVDDTAEVYDPASGTFAGTGNMTAPRAEHTATLLTNGQVLVAGGDANGNPTSELYDPVTGAFTATGDMTTWRDNHTATLLPNGEVLVAGGSTSTALSSAELYNPTTGTWTPTGSLTAARYEHTATLLATGEVLVAGGIGADFKNLSSAELYNPTTGTWTPTGSLSAPRYLHDAVLLGNGKVLVTGQENPGSPVNEPLPSAELYDPATGAWSDGGLGGCSSGFWCEFEGRAVVLSSGKVLLEGGLSTLIAAYRQGATSVARLYDPATNSWSTTGSMITPRRQHTATVLNDGRVLVANGNDFKRGGTTTSAEIYTP